MGVQVSPPGRHGGGQLLQASNQRHGGRLRLPTPATRRPPAGAGW
jgi:hypothetical protein